MRQIKFGSVPIFRGLDCAGKGKSAAALGTKAMVPTLDGEVEVAVPVGTQPECVLRLKGKGLPHFGAETRGDLFLRVEVAVPERLTDEQRRLYEALRRCDTKD